ncbi:gp436 family protein [Alloalcanivorax xenomutans]|uniref:gp436 family protein n=1 Tax=Alloalcanivorax xenomutans TaxID=1094342 RepID=UPI0030083B96
MGYITHAQLAERPGATELAQVATAERHRVVDSALMEATLLGADRSAWSPEDVAVADDALQRIEDAVRDADALINGHLRKRGYAVPMNPVPDLVAVWSRDIARYLLHKDRITDEREDPIVRAYRDALKFLKQIVDGSFSLGADDPVSGSPQEIDVRFEGDPSVFSRRNMRHY